MTTIRTLSTSDLPHIAQLIDTIPFYQDYGVTGQSIAQSLRAVLNDHSCNPSVLIAQRQDMVVGMAWIMEQGAFGRSHYLRLLAVDPNSKRQGIGRLLMQTAEAKHLHPHGLCLLVTQDNHDARRFYEALGYDHCGTLPDYVRSGRHECLYYKAPPRY